MDAMWLRVGIASDGPSLVGQLASYTQTYNRDYFVEVTQFNHPILVALKGDLGLDVQIFVLELQRHHAAAFSLSGLAFIFEL